MSMKKFGFTLIEILVAVLIIAVIAVIIAPKLTSIIPNTDKIKILRHHAMLEQAIMELISTEGIYHSIDENADGDYDDEKDCEGLDCTKKPLIAPYNQDDFRGDDKFKNLISFKLGLENGRYTDGSLWAFNNNPRQITISPNGEGGGCYYSTNCPNPTSYVFDIDRYGNITAGDALTKAYLESPTRTNNRTLDLERAKELLSEMES